MSNNVQNGHNNQSSDSRANLLLLVGGLFLLGGAMIRSGFELGNETADRVLRRYDRDIRRSERKARRAAKEKIKQEKREAKEQAKRERREFIKELFIGKET